MSTVPGRADAEFHAHQDDALLGAGVHADERLSLAADGGAGRWVRWLGYGRVAAVVAAARSSGGGTDPVTRAEKHVSDAQKALSDAQSNLCA